jgi:hypothetical protein
MQISFQKGKKLYKIRHKQGKHFPIVKMINELWTTYSRFQMSFAGQKCCEHTHELRLYTHIFSLLGGDNL